MLHHAWPKVTALAIQSFRRHRGAGGVPFQPSAQQWIRVAADVLLLNGVLVSALVFYYLSTVWDGGPAATSILSGLHEHAWRLIPITTVTLITFACSGLYTYSRTYRMRHKLVLVAEAVTTAFVVVGMLAYVVPTLFALPRSVLLLGWGIALPVFVASRLWSELWRRLVWTEAEAAGARPLHRQRETVLVIGGGGYIGSALVPKLLADGHRVRVLDLLMYGTQPLQGVLDDPMLEIVRADFREIDSLVNAMRGVDQVVHLGGIVGDPACALDEELTIDVNLAATRSIAEVAKGNGIRHFVFASSCSVYGASDAVLNEKSQLAPLSLYARTKVASEKVLLGMADATFTPLIVRFATIHGLSGRTRFDLVVNLLTAKALFDRQITIFGGDQWRPFLHVDDAALAIRQLLHLPAGRGAEIFNVGSNTENYTIRQVGEIIQKYVPDANLVFRGDDKDKRNYRVDFSHIRIMTGFTPNWTVEEGVRQVVQAIQNGYVLDYRDAQYSNERFLSEMGAGGLAPPQIRWAHDLVRAPAPAPGE
jgi:nucleoside-diphosphate-sugar epimerase